MLLTELFNSKIPHKIVKDDAGELQAVAEIGGRTIRFEAEEATNGPQQNLYIWFVSFAQENKEKRHGSSIALRDVFANAARTGRRHLPEPSHQRVTYDKTGAGNEFEVFSFVIEMIKYLIQKRKPEALTFTADKDQFLGGNRAVLYRKLLKRFKAPGYTVKIADHHNKDKFYLLRDDVLNKYTDFDDFDR